MLSIFYCRFQYSLTLFNTIQMNNFFFSVYLHCLYKRCGETNQDRSWFHELKSTLKWNTAIRVTWDLSNVHGTIGVREVAKKEKLSRPRVTLTKPTLN